MKKFHFVSAFSVVTMLTAAAFACGGAGHAGGRAADTNSDGKVTLDEANATMKARFGELDKNKDGAVTTAEIGDRGKRIFERADANKDGKVTMAEATAKLGEWFSKKDKNGDKVLSGDEMQRGHGKGRGPRA